MESSTLPNFKERQQIIHDVVLGNTSYYQVRVKYGRPYRALISRQDEEHYMQGTPQDTVIMNSFQGPEQFSQNENDYARKDFNKYYANFPYKFLTCHTQIN